MRIMSLKPYAVSGVRVYDSALDFFAQTNYTFMPPVNPSNPSKFWVDPQPVYNPTYQPTYHNNYTGKDEPGYLVLATGKDGKPLRLNWETQTVTHDGGAVSSFHTLPLIWHTFTGNATRIAFYAQYANDFPQVPYFIPLADHLKSVGIDPASVQPLELNCADAPYKIPFPIFLPDDLAMRFNGGTVEVFDIQEYVQANPTPSGGQQHTLTDDQLVSGVAQLIFSNKTNLDKALGIRQLAAQ
jgi:hypothetical protein